MVDLEKLEKIREKVIADLEKSIQIYTHNGEEIWINEKYTRELIEKFRNKRSVIPAPVLWAETVDYIIRDELGEQTHGRHPEWCEYWNALTGDKVRG